MIEFKTNPAVEWKVEFDSEVDGVTTRYYLGNLVKVDGNQLMIVDDVTHLQMAVINFDKVLSVSVVIST